MSAVVVAAAAAAGWGTWEELLLGGAVLRHGTRDWDAVAAELRTRFACTPEVCRAKYEDLQQRYSGCKAWFDELRKRRMAELRRALEVSDDSIGSLESKIETLKAEKRKAGLSSSSSPLPSVKSEGMVDESLSKEPSKDGLSAGSFTQETRSNWSPGCCIEPKPEPSTSPVVVAVLEEDRPLGFLKGPRGKRKRKKVCNGKEGSVEESAVDALGSSSVSALLKDNSTSTCDNDNRCRGDVVDDDLVGIFDAIAENKCATVFRRRLDSQKRGRYKKMILQHIDVDTIRSKISKGSLLSAKELYRDLLLLANNALVFYSRTTREYKSANLLRDIVTKSLQTYICTAAAARVSISIAPSAAAAVHDPPPPPSRPQPPSPRPPDEKPPNARVVNNKRAQSKASKSSLASTKGAARKPGGNLGCKAPSKATTVTPPPAAAKKPAGSVDESGKRKGGGTGRQKKGGRTAEEGPPEGGQQSKGGRKRARVK